MSNIKKYIVIFYELVDAQLQLLLVSKTTVHEHNKQYCDFLSQLEKEFQAQSEDGIVASRLRAMFEDF